MSRALILAGALAVACAATIRSTPDEAPPNAPTGDGGVAEDSGLAARELAWLVAHLADDPDPANPRETEAVRRLAARGAPALRGVVEVFRVGDARRAPFARRTFERYLRRVCDHNDARVTRTLAEAQGRAWDGGATTRWPEGDAPWSQSAMERMYGWIDGGARCAE
ncbi:MAG: hypothetical protein U0325_30145 [Polyangiales bacterium]